MLQHHLSEWFDLEDILTETWPNHSTESFRMSSSPQMAMALWLIGQSYREQFLAALNLCNVGRSASTDPLDQALDFVQKEVRDDHMLKTAGKLQPDDTLRSASQREDSCGSSETGPRAEAFPKQVLDLSSTDDILSRKSSRSSRPSNRDVKPHETSMLDTIHVSLPERRKGPRGNKVGKGKKIDPKSDTSQVLKIESQENAGV